MKNLFFRKMFTVTLALAITATIGFVGCSEDTAPVSNNNDESNNSTSLFVTDNITTDALLACGVTTDSPQWEATAALRGKGDKRPHMKRDDLRAILPCLQLTVDQRTQLETLMQAHRDCVKAAVDAHRASIEPMRLRLQELGKSLREQVKAGTITREEAAAQMKAAHEAARTEMQSANETLKAALEACKSSLYPQIAGLLTAEQLVTWNNWLATGEIPCPRGPKHGKSRDSVRVRP